MHNTKLNTKQKKYIKKIFQKTMSNYQEAILKLQHA